MEKKTENIMNEVGIYKGKQDSIKISMNNKGLYSFEIKIYYDSNVDDKDSIIKKLVDIDYNLKEKFNIK